LRRDKFRFFISASEWVGNRQNDPRRGGFQPPSARGGYTPPRRGTESSH
jgi:hypothetical protein